FASSLVSKAPEEELKKTGEEMRNAQYKLESLRKKAEGLSMENFTENSQKTGVSAKDPSKEKLENEQKKLVEELAILSAKHEELNKTRKKIYNTPIDLIRKNSRLAGLLDRNEGSKEKSIQLIYRL